MRRFSPLNGLYDMLTAGESLFLSAAALPLRKSSVMNVYSRLATAFTLPLLNLAAMAVREVFLRGYAQFSYDASREFLKMSC